MWVFWALYLFLVSVRLVFGVFSFGMIHPDEFFQSQEVMARHTLARESSLYAQLWIPWEYLPPKPNRSVLFPALVAGLPYRLLRGLLGRHELDGATLLLVPRLVLWMLSLVTDRIFWRLAKKLHEPTAPRSLVLFASSWTSWVFATRPFSNTLESFWLLLCVASLLLVDHKSKSFGLGLLAACGVFTRFTFVLFFVVVGVQLVRTNDTALVQLLRHKKGDDEANGPWWLWPRLKQLVQVVLHGFLGFCVAGSVVVALDSWYFDQHEVVVAPFNNFLYNLQYQNVAQHGIHPRITHALVNLPLLFGVVYFQALAEMASMLWSRFRRSTPAEKHTPRHWLFWCTSVLVPLVGLSLSPHQEPRFLLPLTLPLHLLVGQTLQSTKRSNHWVFWTIHVVFNVLLLVFFGQLHQAGIVPMALSIAKGSTANAWCQLDPTMFGADQSGPKRLVFYKTYMPPRFLFAGATAPLEVVDLAGIDRDQMLQRLQDEQHQVRRTLNQNQPKKKRLVVVTPAPVARELVPRWHEHHMSATLVGACGPHVSTEHLPTSWHKELFTLQAWAIDLSNDTD